MANTNKYNYYITLINMCDSLDNADALITEIADDKTISHADYSEAQKSTCKGLLYSQL